MTGLVQVGIDFVSTGEDKVKKAYDDLGRAEDQLQQKMKVGVNVGNKNAKSLDQIVTASIKAENKIRRLAQAHQQGRIDAVQFKDELNKITVNLRSMGMTRAKTEVFNLAKSYNTATTEVTKQTAELKKLQSALNQTAGSKRRVSAAAKTTTDATSRTRQVFLNTANSIAILDGPLGGIASRFSAFGVLIGRTGVLLGVALAGFSALGIVAAKSIKSFMDFEVQTAKIEAILKTTGSQAGLTASEIESMASRIALSTLESEDAIRSAAMQLLTFKNVGKDVFETTLKAAADMAALGFGTVESEAVKLAKALEDPRQSLTSLSRSGITFTRQQRQLIASLVESGRQAEAMERILDNVNKQVGGAGEAAARDTMAGAFDTIGQAVSRASRELGDFIANTVGLADAVAMFAKLAEPYAIGRLPLEEQLEASIARVKELRTEGDKVREIFSAMPVIGRGVVALLGTSNEELIALEARIAALPELIRLEKQASAARSASNEVKSRTDAIDNLLAQSDALRENIGLTEQQVRLNSMLAAEGFLNVDISEAVREYRDNLVAAGADQFVLTQAVEEFTLKLLEGESAAKELAESLDLAELGRQFVNNSRSIEDQNSLLESQLALMDDGIGASEARRQAELNLQLAQAETLRLAKEITDEDYEQLRAAILKNQALSADLANRTAAAREFLEHQKGINDLLEAGRKAEIDRNRTYMSMMREKRNEMAMQAVINQHGQDSVQVAIERARQEAIAANLTAEQRDNFIAAAIEAYNLADATEDVAESTSNIAHEMSMAANEALRFVSNLESGGGVNAARARIAGLRAELGARQGGAGDIEAAAARAEAEVRARPEFQLALTGPEGLRQETLAGLNREVEAARLNAEAGMISSEISGLGRTPGTPSGGASNVVDINAILDARRQQIEQERVLLGLSGQQREAQAIYFDLLKQNEEAVNRLTDTELMAAAKVEAAAIEKNRVLEEGLKRQQDISKLLESSMERAFMSIVDGTATVKDAFRSMAAEIIKELYRIFVVKQITGMIANAIVPGSVNANGNAFSNGNVVPFADGGVVGSPTTFPMSGGKTGLMGEAGPEAIMPLKRGKDGKLGVAADGGGSVNIVQNFNISANGDDSVKRIIRQQIPQIAEATKAAVVDAKRRGGSYGRAFG